MTELAVDLFQVAEIELVYKQEGRASEKPQIIHSKDAYSVLLQSWDDNKIDFVEQAKILLLNRANRVLGICEISTGGITGTVVDPRLVFVAALKANATSIILAHNHPSGNLKPSEADRRLTEKITEGGKLLEIAVLDHLVITREGYYSFSNDTTILKERVLQPSMEIEF